MPRSGYYVDNAQNRRLGRVGMPYGSAVFSRNSLDFISIMSPKTYVDNPLNRALGRVGMEHGTAVHSRSINARSIPSYSSYTYFDHLLTGFSTYGSRPSSSTSSSGSSIKTYVDNSLDRSSGTVRMEPGTALHSRSRPSSSTSSSGSSIKTYVDNALDRSSGTVRMEPGTALHSRSGSARPTAHITPVRATPSPKTHMDSALNRPLDRNGKENGRTAVHNKPTQTEKCYANNVANCRLGRSKETAADDVCTRGSFKAFLKEHEGVSIDYSELTISAKIGEGGFGEVYWAHLGTSREVVAVKLLHNQGVTKRRLQVFVKEASIFCKLKHHNIVRFIGICQATPKLAIVMEFMDLSLYEALHVNVTSFDQADQLAIMGGVCDGLSYLHSQSVAHCDLKSQNILLSNVPIEAKYEHKLPVIPKITDFGLREMKSDASISQSKSSSSVIAGTLRYSAPEILRGELLRTIEDFKMADIYSVALVFWELAVQEIPFEGLTTSQLRKHVGWRRMAPSSKFNTQLSREFKDILNKCWSAKPELRPVCDDLALEIWCLACIYPSEE